MLCLRYTGTASCSMLRRARPSCSMLQHARPAPHAARARNALEPRRLPVRPCASPSLPALRQCPPAETLRRSLLRQSAVAMPSASTPLRRTDYGACLQEKEVRRPLRRLGDTAPPLRQRRGGLGRVYRSVELLAKAAQHRRRIARHGAGRIEEPAHRAAAAQPGASARHCAAPLCCDVSSGRPTRHGCCRPLRECVPHRPAAASAEHAAWRRTLSGYS